MQQKTPEEIKQLTLQALDAVMAVVDLVKESPMGISSGEIYAMTGCKDLTLHNALIKCAIATGRVKMSSYLLTYVPDLRTGVAP